MLPVSTNAVIFFENAMVKPPKLTEGQKRKLKIFETKLRGAVYKGNYEHAKELVFDIQNLLRPTGHETRLMKSKNWLFEAALEAGELGIAERGFQGILQKMNKSTRVYLEASALLAIVYLRQGKITEAEPFMRAVLRNDKIIKSEKRNRQFRLNVIKRFEEEATIASFRNKFRERMSARNIQNEAGQLLQQKTDEEIYEMIGKASPPETKQLILKVSEFAKKQLPPADIKLLPSPRDRINDKNVGITVFQASKNVLWRSLCDPKSDIYQAWVHKGIGFFFSKIYLGTAVIQSLTNIGMGIKSLAVPLTALIIKFGIEIYCEKYKPQGVMLE